MKGSFRGLISAIVSVVAGKDMKKHVIRGRDLSPQSPHTEQDT
jgi:hypothetical protein